MQEYNLQNPKQLSIDPYVEINDLIVNYKK